MFLIQLVLDSFCWHRCFIFLTNVDNKVKGLVVQLCPVLWDIMDYSQLGFSVHGILQSRILEWVAIPLSRGSSWTRNQTCISCIAIRFFPVWATREANITLWADIIQAKGDRPFYQWLNQTHSGLVTDKSSDWNSPGGPVVKTGCSHCRGMGSVPNQGTKTPHATQLSQKKVELPNKYLFMSTGYILYQLIT